MDHGGHLSFFLQLVNTPLLIVVIPFLLDEETPLNLGSLFLLPNMSFLNSIFISWAI